MLRRSRIVLTTSLALACVLAAAGAAQGHWNAAGAGSGRASTGSILPVNLSAGTPVVALRPAGRSAVSVVVSNPNASAVRLDSLVLDASRGTNGFTVDAGHERGCSLAGLLTFASQTNGGAGWSIPAAAGVVAGTRSIILTDALSMSGAAPSGCQGATFTVSVTAGP